MRTDEVEMAGGASFIHTADWHVGATFGFADDETLGVLAAARLEAIAAIASVARNEGTSLVLVAGDVYDVERPTERTLRQPIERMAACPDLSWHLIPGNHDPHRAGGPWERLLGHGLPANVIVHLDERPCDVGGVALLPAVLRERRASGDPTSCFDGVATPDGVPRVGLAHGSIRGFDENGETARNRIEPDRARRSSLAYLALGDWHGAQEGAPSTWYCGTPETDGFAVGGNGGGDVLAVRLAGPSGTPSVTPHHVGRYSWQRMAQDLFEPSDVDALEARLRGAGATLERALVWVTLSGALTLADLARLDERLEGVAAALRLLRIDRDALRARPNEADLDAIEPSGPIRTAAERLARASADGDELAGAALIRLAHMARRPAAGSA